jgi:hypothetical protein
VTNFEAAGYLGLIEDYYVMTLGRTLIFPTAYRFFAQSHVIFLSTRSAQSSHSPIHIQSLSSASTSGAKHLGSDTMVVKEATYIL